MQKLSKFSILLIVSNMLTVSILFWGCSETEPEPCPPTPCLNNDYQPTCNISDQFRSDLAEKMISNYRVHHWQIINANSPNFQTSGDKVDARCAWFSLETLKAFINTIESKATAIHTACSTNPYLELGIRIYYAEYPSGPEMTAYSLNPALAGMHTLLMIPTYNDGTNNVDFDPADIGPNACTPKSIFGPTITALPPTSSMQNHGGLTPPPYPCEDYWNSGSMFMLHVDKIDKGELATEAAINPYQTACPPIR